MRPLNNSVVPGFGAKPADLGSDEYSAKVAAPIMGAVDKMPKAYRDCVNEFGYIDVYHAWRNGWTVEMIKSRARDGFFHLR